MIYEEVINDLRFILNKKGRFQKGFNRQEEFLKLLKILKNDFNKEISTYFLLNLINNKNLSNRQKTIKVYELTKGFNKNKSWFYKRDLEVLGHKKDIIEYAHSKKNPLNMPSVIMSENEEQQIKEINEISENTIFSLIGTAEENFKNRVKRRNTIYKTGVLIKDIRTENIGKEFIQTHKKAFSFITA